MRTLDRAVAGPTPGTRAGPRGKHRRRSSSRTSRVTRVAIGALLWSVIGFGVTLVAAISASTLIGYRSLVVMSGSMEPVLGPGDLVIDRRISPPEVRVGDVVTFRDPQDSSRLITHRVRDVQFVGDSIAMTTKGDASNSEQHWAIRADGSLGKVVLRIPAIGRPIFWARSRFGAFALLIVPSILLCAYFLAQIWRPAPPEATRGSQR